MTDCKKWQQAMNEEIESLKTNNKWDLVYRLDDKKVLNCKWVYRIKDDENDPNYKLL